MIETPASQQFQLGLLALKNQLVSQSTLVAAFETWWTDRSRQFGQILVDLGAISDASHQQLVKLIEETNPNANGNSTLRENDPELAGEACDGSVATDLFLPGMELSRATMKWEASESIDDRKRSQTIQSRHADNDRFRKVRQHALGGLGVVFVAEDQQLHRPVALKQIRDDRGDSDLVRCKFIQEAEITGQLEHPGVVPIYALGIDAQGKPYYAMRFIQGQDLGLRIREFHSNQKKAREAFDGSGLKHLLRRFLDVCNAIEYAHSRGVLHRDLKPANVMLGEFGETLVVDWGLAKVLPGFAMTGFAGDLPSSSAKVLAGDRDGLGGETMNGQFMGTAAYASPEQLLGQIDLLGTYSDVYSLGAILFELLTGQAPILDKRSAPGDIADHINNDRIPKARILVSACPAPLESICRKAMAAKIEQRYQNASELKDDLEAWLDDEPCKAHQDSFVTRAKRWIRHHPAVVGTLATVFVCTAVATAALLGISNSKNRRILAEKTNAEAVTKFLTSALQSTDPDRQGNEVTVADTLRSSELVLLKDLSMKPSTKVHVASAMIDSYLSLNQSEDAMRMAEYMNRVCDENLDPSSPETLLSRCQLALTYWFENKSKEAIELLEKNVRPLAKALGESNADVLSVQDNLAFMYMSTERVPEAERLSRRTLATYDKYHLLNNANAIQSMGNLAQILVARGRREEGIAMLKEASVRAEEKLGPTHTVTLRLLHNLGEFMTDPREALEALEVSRKSYDGTLERYGRNHGESLTARNSVVANLILLKKWEDAVPLLEESELQFVGKKPDTSGDTSGQAAQVRSVLILAYLQSERFASVERLTRKMLLPEFAKFAGLPPQAAKVVLAMALIRQDRSVEAEEVLDELQHTPGFQELSPASLAVLQGLQGEIAFSTGDYDKALKFLNSSWEKLSSAEPKEIYSQVPRYLAVALAKAYERVHDETNRALWLERAISLGYEGK